MTTPSKSTRVVNVQVPGEAPKAPEQAAAPQPTEQAKAEPDAASATATDSSGGTASVDMEALRAHIREEERAILQAELRAELGQQIQAASTALSATAPAPARSKRDYANMRAADIDPATLTAPVKTLDGYLCPPAPEAKK